ncbi:MAG: hypothetical protein RL424_1067, partial [Pseudomonadota bacterium]
ALTPTGPALASQPQAGTGVWVMTIVARIDGLIANLQGLRQAVEAERGAGFEAVLNAALDEADAVQVLRVVVEGELCGLLKTERHNLGMGCEGKACKQQGAHGSKSLLERLNDLVRG